MALNCIGIVLRRDELQRQSIEQQRVAEAKQGLVTQCNGIVLRRKELQRRSYAEHRQSLVMISRGEAGHRQAKARRGIEGNEPQRQ